MGFPRTRRDSDPVRPVGGSQPLTERLVDRLSVALDRSTDRRSVLQKAALVGSAVATGGLGYVLRPGTAYASVCGDGATCTSGWTAFCCTVHGSNTCPPYSFPAGWWKIDASPFCNGDARYIVDCNATCPTQCSCRCASGTCDERRICCNQFRYGQCNTEIACYGPVVCRVALCTPPWVWSPACTTTSRTDNRTLTHNAPCLIGTGEPPPEPCPFEPAGPSAPYETVLATPVGQPTYVPLTPARLMDTRAGGTTVDGISAGGGSLGRCGVRTVKVTGRGGVPASGVGTVVLNVTATEPTAWGFLSVFPTGESRPRTSNLNFAPGQSVANLVMARVGAGGQVSIHNEFGSTQVIVDVAGWFPAGSAYNAVPPARLMDTRPGGSTTDGFSAGTGAAGPGEIRTLIVAGRGRVPASGAAAVVLNVTATLPTAAGYLTVFPTGAARPNASNLNFAPGQTIPNLVVAKIGSGGQVSIYNATGSTQVIADVFGWIPTGSDYHPLTPARLVDTRTGASTIDGRFAGQGAVGPGGTRSLLVAGRGGVPASGVAAVVLNVTVTGPTAGGYLTVHPSDEPRPNASNLNFAPGQTIANLVVAKVGADGRVSIYNAMGSTHLIADVAGWLPTFPP